MQSRFRYARSAHAGDIGKPEVLDGLRAVAPVTAIRGNVDKWAKSLPDVEVLEIEGMYLYVLHDVNTLDIDPKAAGIDVVISGHSHEPLIREQDGVIYLNPGSGGRLYPAIVELPIEVSA